ncbi:unnamed protein product, partial [marine sediment metagenome]
TPTKPESIDERASEAERAKYGDFSVANNKEI